MGALVEPQAMDLDALLLLLCHCNHAAVKERWKF
jgi:hypothetical protein